MTYTERRHPITAYVGAGLIAAAALVLLAAGLAMLAAGWNLVAGVLLTAAVFVLGQAAGVNAVRVDARAIGGAYLIARRNGRWEVIPSTEPRPLDAGRTARAIADHLERLTPPDKPSPPATRHPRRPPGHGLTFPSQEDPRR